MTVPSLSALCAGILLLLTIYDICNITLTLLQSLYMISLLPLPLTVYDNTIPTPSMLWYEQPPVMTYGQPSTHSHPSLIHYL